MQGGGEVQMYRWFENQLAHDHCDEASLKATIFIYMSAHKLAPPVGKWPQHEGGKTDKGGVNRLELWNSVEDSERMRKTLRIWI